jgi:hypothetical protein
MEYLNPKEVKNWIRENEDNLYDRLRTYIKLEGSGCGTGIENGVFTCKGYSDASAFILAHSIKANFGELPIWLVQGVVSSFTTEIPQTRVHTWTRFPGDDRKLYFIDSAIGEVTPTLSTTAFDLVTRESNYFEPKTRIAAVITPVCPKDMEKYILKPTH